MTRDERFSAAVEMAKCFISNGDIRLKTTREGDETMNILGDLIDSLYKMLGAVDSGIDPGA